jgi:hypothetical protein
LCSKWDLCDGCGRHRRLQGDRPRSFTGGGNPADGTFAPVSVGDAMDENSEPGCRRLGRLDRKMTPANGAPGLGQDLAHDMGGLASLPGLERVSEQIGGLIAVLRAEQARRQAGVAVKRPAWKNLVFAGGPGSGRTRAARAVARLYTELGLLSFGHLREIAAADLIGTTWQETGTLVTDAARRAGDDLLMINEAHGWHNLPDRGRHLLRCLYKSSPTLATTPTVSWP